MIVCKNCGHHNEQGDQFCGSCGSFLEWSGEKIVEPEPEPEPVPEPEPEAKPGIIDRVKAAVGIDETSPAAAPGSATVGETPTEAELQERQAGEDRAAAEAEAKAREEAERKAIEEAERKARKEAEAKAQQETERKAKEEAEAKAREEAEAKAKAEQEARARQEAERKAREEAERKAVQQAEAKSQEEADQLAKEKGEAEARAQKEAEARARAEAEAQAREEAERKATEEAEAKAKAESEARARADAEAKAREEAERQVKEEAAAKVKAEREADAAAERQRRAAAMVAKTPPATKEATEPAAAAAAAPAPSVPSPTTPPPARPAAVSPTAVRPAKAKPRPAPKAPTAPSRELKPGDLICGQCGEGNDPARKFCRRCGNSLVEAVVVKVPWWRRLFTRKKKVVEAGERPMRGKERGRARSAIGTVFRIVVILFVIVMLVLMIGPWRGDVIDIVTGAFSSVRRTVAPKFEPVRPTAAEATSSAGGHPPSAAIDQIKNTYWAEGAPGDGTGQTLVLIFDKPADIAKVGFIPGASAKPEEFVAQPRPKDIHLVFSDGSTADVQLADKAEFQSFEVEAKGVTRVEVHIVSVFGSLKGQDCSIAEVEFFSKE